MKEEDTDKISFWEHLSELRSRLIYIVTFFIVVFLAFWFVRNDLLNIYLLPLHKVIQEVSGEVILLKIVDKFFIHLKTTFFFSILLILPFITYQIWRFVSPGLYEKEKKIIKLLLFLTLLLFYIGLSIAYFFVIPFGITFLVNYSVDSSGVITSLIINNKLSLSLLEQINFTQKFLLVFGFIFQLPLIMVIATRLGLVEVAYLAKYRRHFIVACFIVAAILTPPDPITMIGLGLPLIILFEFGLFLSKIMNK